MFIRIYQLVPVQKSLKGAYYFEAPKMVKKNLPFRRGGLSMPMFG
mgnify:CR=1 FL=1